MPRATTGSFPVGSLFDLGRKWIDRSMAISETSNIGEIALW